MPVLTQQVTPGRIMSIAVPKTLTQKKHFLAAGDSQGNMFVMLVPRYYTKPKPQEDQYVLELMNREETRMAGWVTDAENRDERIKAINQAFKDSRTMVRCRLIVKIYKMNKLTTKRTALVIEIGERNTGEGRKDGGENGN